MDLLLSEPAIVPDIYASGITAPEDLGDGNLRFTAFAKQRAYGALGRETEYIIVNRLIVPLPAVMLSIQATMKVLGISCCGGERLKLRH